MSYVAETMVDVDLLDSANTAVTFEKRGQYKVLIRNPEALGGSKILLMLYSTDTVAVYQMEPQETIIAGPFHYSSPPSLRSSSGAINNIPVTAMRDGDETAKGEKFEIVSLGLTIPTLALTVNAEAADDITIDMAASVATTLDYFVQTYRDATMEPSTAAFYVDESGAGSQLSTANQSGAVVRTSSGGVAQVTVHDVAGASGQSVWVEFTPWGHDAPIMAVKITFD